MEIYPAKSKFWEPTKGETFNSFLDFVKYSRRLVRDLEAKGLARTAVEGINLSIHADDNMS